MMTMIMMMKWQRQFYYWQLTKSVTLLTTEWTSDHDDDERQCSVRPWSLTPAIPCRISRARAMCLQAVVSDSCHEASCLPHRRHAHHPQAACRLSSISVPVLAAVNAAGLSSQLEAAAKVEQPGDVEPVYVDVEHWRRVAADGDTAHINWLPRDHC